MQSIHIENKITLWSQLTYLLLLQIEHMNTWRTITEKVQVCEDWWFGSTTDRHWQQRPHHRDRTCKLHSWCSCCFLMSILHPRKRKTQILYLDLKFVWCIQCCFCIGTSFIFTVISYFLCKKEAISTNFRTIQYLTFQMRDFESKHSGLLYRSYICVMIKWEETLYQVNTNCM